MLRSSLLLAVFFSTWVLNCRFSPESDLDTSGEIRFAALFSNAMLNPDADNRVNAGLTEGHKNRVTFFRPIGGKFYLHQNAMNAGFLTYIKTSSLKDAKAICADIMRVIPGSMLADLSPLVELSGASDSFSGSLFLISFEKRTVAHNKSPVLIRNDLYKNEIEELGKEKSISSIFAASLLQTNLYDTFHILGFNNLSDARQVVLGGDVERALRKLEARDTNLFERIRVQ